MKSIDKYRLSVYERCEMGIISNEEKDVLLESIDENVDSKLEKIKEFNKELCVYEYIVVKPDGSTVSQIKSDSFKDYLILSPSQFKSHKGGICWDYVVYEASRFGSFGVKFNTFFFCIVNKEGIPTNTHTFLLFYHNDKVYWFEASWKTNMGIFEFENENEALSFIVNKLKSVNDKKFDNFIVKYNPSKYIGKNENEFLSEMGNAPEYVYKTIKNPKMKTIQSIKVDSNGRIV
jgi:hypothetical protein